MNRNEKQLRPVQMLAPGDLTMLPAHHAGERSLRPPSGHLTIRPRICICCGEPMVERGNALSRDFNVCASCSSLANGMEEASQPSALAEVYKLSSSYSNRGSAHC